MMINKILKQNTRKVLFFIFLSFLSIACSKIESGFVSPNMQYSPSTIAIIRGRISNSVALTLDGSSIPINVVWTHIHDVSGNIVDDIFKKEYPTTVWSSGFSPLIDTTYAGVMGKLMQGNVPPIQVNPTNGQIISTPTSVNVPLGTYSMDLQVTNNSGTQILKNAMQLNFIDGPTTMIQDSANAQFQLVRLTAYTPTSAGTYYSGYNNPYVMYNVIRTADSPYTVTIKITDKNGVVFDPAKGEILRRPEPGLNPVPAFYPNLQTFALGTYKALDTAFYSQMPLTPFPLASTPNGQYSALTPYIYYILPTEIIQLDKTTSWSGTNQYGNYYKGTSDSHYVGVYRNGLYDLMLRIPFSIYAPGSYAITLKLLNVTHR